MEKSYSRIFEIDGAKFCFGNNPNYKLNEFSAKYRLMILILIQVDGELLIILET